MDRKNYQRYRIEGTFTAVTPVRVGTGLEDAERIPEDVRVMTVATDAENRALIPGSTVRGRVHSLALQAGYDPNALSELFGTGEHGKERGGRLIFQDARPVVDSPVPPLFQSTAVNGRTPLDWYGSRGTYVMAGVVLNRTTRTAEPHKLYHYEMVPPGTVFKVVICGEGLVEEELAFLLALLDQFDEGKAVALGGLTAHGCGIMKWKLDQVSGLRTEEDVRQWLNGTSVGFEGFPVIPAESISRLADPPDIDVNQYCLTLGLEIAFEGPFMINDPSRCKKTEGDDESVPNHAYLRNSQGRIVLTAKSLHGALRGQAERIVRTIAPPANAVEMACYIDSRDEACEPISERAEETTLCLTCRLFGGNGWRSPVTISDFHPAANGEGQECCQDFVAIDRFTGAAADKKKFRSLYRFGPTFSGQIRIDLARIDATLAGLLVFTLRDLIEGDIPLGFGRSKGFGSCRARITQVTLPRDFPDWTEESLALCEDRVRLASPLFNENQGLPLQSLVEAFLQEVI